MKFNLDRDTEHNRLSFDVFINTWSSSGPSSPEHVEMEVRTWGVGRVIVVVVILLYMVYRTIYYLGVPRLSSVGSIFVDSGSMGSKRTVDWCVRTYSDSS